MAVAMGGAEMEVASRAAKMEAETVEAPAEGTAEGRGAGTAAVVRAAMAAEVHREPSHQQRASCGRCRLTCPLGGSERRKLRRQTHVVA